MEVSDDDLDACASADWLVLTSPNGAERFFDLFGERRDLRDLAGVRLAAIGPVTADGVRRRGLRVEAVPAEFRAEALAEVFGDVEFPAELTEGHLLESEGFGELAAKRGYRVVGDVRTVVVHA